MIPVFQQSALQVLPRSTVTVTGGTREAEVTCWVYQHHEDVSFEVFVVVTAQLVVFWLVTSCNTVGGHKQDYEPPSSRLK
jgi:hypothetical protein